MQLVEQAVLAPAQCLIRKTHKGRMVDLLNDFDITDQGRKYICEQAVRDMAALFGMLPEDKAQELQERLDEAKAANARLQQEVEDLREFKAVITAGLKAAA